MNEVDLLIWSFFILMSQLQLQRASHKEFSIFLFIGLKGKTSDT